MNVVLVALGAAVGAALRFHLATRYDKHLERGLPLGTFAVNVVGSLLLGFFSARALDEHLYALLGTGLCGGLTTYSAFAVQTHRLGPLRLRGVVYAVATIVVAVAAASLGFAVGS